MLRRKLSFALLVVAMVSAGSWGLSQEGGGDPFGLGGEDPFGSNGETRAADAPEATSPRSINKESDGEIAKYFGFPDRVRVKEIPRVRNAPTPSFPANGNLATMQQIERVLSNPVTVLGLNFSEVPLSVVVDFLRDEYEIEIQIDQEALDDLRLTDKVPININVRDISFRAALRQMLKEHDLTYVVADEVLLITSEDEALSRLTVKVYPVGDLLQPREGERPETAARVEDLIVVLYSNVVSDSWSEVGGSGEVKPLQPGLLIVTQTQEVHEEIAQLLCALRQARAHEFARPHQHRPAATATIHHGGRVFYGRGEPNKEEEARDKKQRGEADRGGGGAY